MKNRISKYLNYDRKWLVIGSGGHARTVLQCLESQKNKVEGVLDIKYQDKEDDILGYPVLGDLKLLDEGFTPDVCYLALAIGDNQIRRRHFIELSERGYIFPPFLHATAIVSPTCNLGQGVQISTGCIINSMVEIGINTILNTGTIIDHEAKIGSHSHIAPGARIAGRVTIGSHCFVGIGSSIIDKVKIGDFTVIGAGSVVLHDLPGNCTAVGTPTRVIK
ncbi:acetyltransferase [Thermodesulfobacteriota bacterium]